MSLLNTFFELFYKYVLKPIAELVQKLIEQIQTAFLQATQQQITLADVESYQYLATINQIFSIFLALSIVVVLAIIAMSLFITFFSQKDYTYITTIGGLGFILFIIALYNFVIALALLQATSEELLLSANYILVNYAIVILTLFIATTMMTLAFGNRSHFRRTSYIDASINISLIFSVLYFFIALVIYITALATNFRTERLVDLVIIAISFIATLYAAKMRFSK